MPACGSQITLCDVPIRFDTYRGCSHSCRYCFVYRSYDINNIKKFEGPDSLLNFIKGKRCHQTNWCDWDIPLHWGGVSDPFQPIEKKHRQSLKCLKIFKETQYPFIVSTKGRLIGDKQYYELLADCNCVLQVSLVSKKYDEIETGAPTFDERIKILKKITPKMKRVIIRIQPYIREVKKEILANLEVYKDIGIHGVVIEGMKFIGKKQGLVGLGGDFVYSKDLLLQDFLEIREKCHKLGLKFYSGENRLRNLGDDLCCCGVDGLDGFKVNTANFNHFFHKKETFKYSKNMEKVDTAMPFKANMQSTIFAKGLKHLSYKKCMELSLKDTSAVCNFLGILKKKKPQKNI